MKTVQLGNKKWGGGCVQKEPTTHMTLAPTLGHSLSRIGRLKSLHMVGRHKAPILKTIHRVGERQLKSSNLYKSFW